MYIHLKAKIHDTIFGSKFVAYNILCRVYLQHCTQIFVCCIRGKIAKTVRLFKNLRKTFCLFCFVLLFKEKSTFFIGEPPRFKTWLFQCMAYLAVMLTEKIVILILFQFNFWTGVKKLILKPISGYPKLELVVVLLLVPFVINVSSLNVF